MKKMNRAAIVGVAGLAGMLFTSCGVYGPAPMPEETEMYGSTAETESVMDDDGNVLVNEINFPDEYFRKFVEKFADSNGDRRLTQEEIDGVESIFVYGGDYGGGSIRYDDLESLEGISYFTNLKDLQCYETHLKSLDCSSLKNLETLEIQIRI